MPTWTQPTRITSVYPFGTIWHWKCGHVDSPSTCLGGRGRSEEEVQAAADRHIAVEHTEEWTGPEHPDGCRWCNAPEAGHGVRPGDMGMHEYKPPTKQQVSYRYDHARVTRNAR